MSRRHYNKSNNQRKRRTQQFLQKVIYEVKLTPEEKEQLTNEGILYNNVKNRIAIEAMSLLKASKETMMTKTKKSGFILSKQWFDSWKQYVGYEATIKGEEPSGKKYGRDKPKSMNEDLIEKKEDFHQVPQGYEQLDQPLKKDLEPSKDYIIIDEPTWTYFYAIYGGTALLRQTNEKGEFDLQFLCPYFIFINKTMVSEIQALNQQNLNQNTNILEYKRLQIMSSWNFDDLELFLSKKVEGEFKLWQMDQSYDIALMKTLLMKTINNKKLNLKGQIIDRSEMQLKLYIKSHYTLIVDQVGFNQSNVQRVMGQNDQTGICEFCVAKVQLIIVCKCQSVYYCSKKCKYSDQEFHSLHCSYAYDSDDDQELENIQTQQQYNVGLQNLGNTCYMNSALQCLISSEVFQIFMLDRKYTNQSSQKNKMLCHKLEKLIKYLLFINQQSFSPISFRQYFSKLHPAFGSKNQQDAGEFLFYLFDALNSETQQQQLDEGSKNIQLVDPTDTEIINEDNSSSSDENEEEIDQQDKQIEKQSSKLVNFDEYKQKPKKLFVDENYLNVWEKEKEQQGVLISENFLGLWKSQVECPNCQKVSYNYDTFTVLPLHLDIKIKEVKYIVVYVVLLNWKKTYLKAKKQFDNFTMLQALKLEVAEEFNLNPLCLIGALTTKSYVRKFFFHEEDPVEICANDALYEENRYLVFYETEKELQQMNDDDIFFGIEMHCLEKRSAFSQIAEDSYICFPKVLTVNKNDLLSTIYQKVFASLAELSNSQEILQLLSDNDNVQLSDKEIFSMLKYQIDIQYKLPQKKKCPFSCGRSFKKEYKQSDHQCTLPFNMATFGDYLEAFNYNNQFLSLIINYKEQEPPKDFRVFFDEIQKLNKQRDPTCKLQQLLDHFQSPEVLTLENLYYCDECKNMCEAVKKLELKIIPNQLIIQLKRFHFDEDKGVYKKNTMLVEYPEEITINEIKYGLYGVVLHSGNLDNGHYIAFGKRQDQWFQFNDEKVEEEKNYLNHKNAYLLFYQSL